MSKANMRSKNSAITMGSVRLKSKREAFSISSASAGSGVSRSGAAAPTREIDFKADEEAKGRDLGSLGSENWGRGDGLGFGVGSEEGRGIWVLEEAMIMLAMSVVTASEGRLGIGASSLFAGWSD